MREQNPLEVADEPHGEDQCLKLMRLGPDSVVMTFHQQSGRMRRHWEKCRCSEWIVRHSYKAGPKMRWMRSYVAIALAHE